jgi:hypothetical protein
VYKQTPHLATTRTAIRLPGGGWADRRDPT